MGLKHNNIYLSYEEVEILLRFLPTDADSLKPILEKLRKMI